MCSPNVFFPISHSEEVIPTNTGHSHWLNVTSKSGLTVRSEDTTWEVKYRRDNIKKNLEKHGATKPTGCTWLRIQPTGRLLWTESEVFIEYQVDKVLRHYTKAHGVTAHDTVSLDKKNKETSSVYDCTVEDVEYICNSNSTLIYICNKLSLRATILLKS